MDRSMTFALRTCLLAGALAASTLTVLAQQPAATPAGEPAAGEPAAGEPAAGETPPTETAPTPTDGPPAEPKTVAPAKPQGPPAGASKAETIAWEAGQLVDEGALKAAEAKANLATSVDGDSAAGRYQVARIRIREGRIIDAYQVLKQAVAKEPTHAPSHMLLMRVAIMGGGTPTAEVRALEGIVANAPDKLLLKMALAEGFLATGQYRQAIKAARQVLKKAETSVGAMKLLARAYFASKRVAAAEAIIRRTRDIRPDAEASHILARIRIEQSRLPAARDLLEESVKLKPDYVEALSNLGLVYIRVRNYAKAEDALTKAVSLAPGFAEAFLNLGAAQRGGRRFEAAEKSWKKVLALNKRMADAHYNLGILYLENPLPGRDRIKQLQTAIGEFNTYKKSGQAAATDKNVDKYLGEAQLLIKQEKARRSEELKQTDEEKKAAAERKAAEEKAAAEKKAADEKKAAEDAAKPPAETPPAEAPTPDGTTQPPTDDDAPAPAEPEPPAEGDQP